MALDPSVPSASAGACAAGALLGDVEPHELLGHVLDTMPGGLFTVDPGGAVVCWNRFMEELTGWAAEEVIGRTCAVLAGDTCGGGACPGSGRACPLFADGQVHQKRCTIRRRDGSRVTVLKNAKLVRDSEGRIVGGVEALTDLTGVVRLEEEVETLRSAASGRAGAGGIVGRHPSMRRLADVVELAARSSFSVLVLGETGTGKELVARAVHDASDRSAGPFVRVSCAALSETLLESELFGHVRGAFTGAVSGRKGRFEAADGGTIFLDEIGDVSATVQTKLLRVLQEREFERVGDNAPVKVDIRVVAATNQDLLALCERGRFRRDLYYRLAVIPVPVPPLRERRSDIPLLVEHFLSRLNRSLGRDIRGLAPETLQRLVAYSWPGNVRELQHALEYAFVVARGELIDDGCLPPGLRDAQAVAVAAVADRRSRARPAPDAELVREALRGSGGNRERASRALGVSRVTLWKWMRALGLDGFPRSRETGR